MELEELASLLKTLKYTSPSDQDQSSLWAQLTEVLSSEWAAKQGLSLVLPLSLLTRISTTLRTKNSPVQQKMSFECLQAVLSLPVATVLMAQLDTAVQLLSAMMEYTIDLLTTPDGYFSNEVHQTLVLLVGHFSSVVDRHGNAKKVFNSVVSSLIEPYVVLCWRLHHQECSGGGDGGGDGGVTDLMQELDKVPTSLLAEECMAELQQYLSKDGGELEKKKTKKNVPGSYVEGFFTLLHSCAVKNRAALALFIPHLFLLFITRNQRVKAVKKHCEFQLLAKFGDLLGFHGDLGSGAVHVTPQFKECSPEEKSCVLHSLSKCLSCAGDHGVYLATEDDGRQIEWLQALCGCLITGEVDLENIAGFYSCLSALLQLNHMSVEPFLPTVWSTILDQEEQDSSCEEFCSIIIATYSKLHQLHRLLEMAVQGGMESSCSRLTRVFPGVVGEEFERALSSTHPNQCSTILDWLCGRVEEVCVQPLSAHLSVEGPPKKKKKRLSAVAPLLPDTQHVVLVRMCDMTCQTLCHLPVDSWQGRSAEEACKGLCGMEKRALMLLDIAAKLPPGSKEHQTAAICSLLLVYGVYKLFHVVHSTVATDLSLPVVTSGDLSHLAVSPLCKHIIGRIALLDLLSCQLPCEAAVHRLIQVPRPSAVETNICSASWNGEILSIINDESSLVSSWQLTLRALPHVWPAVPADGLHDIAALILKVFTLTDSCSEPNLLTIRSVTMELLGSAVFQVMNTLHCQLVDTMAEHIAHQLLDCSRFTKPLKKLVRRVLKCVRNGQDDQLDLLRLLQIEGGGCGECTPPHTEEEVEQWTQALQGMVELIVRLPLHGMPLEAVHQVTTVVMATDILTYKLLQHLQYIGSEAFLQCACDVRTVLARVVRSGGRRGTSPPWFLDMLLRWVWLSAPPMERTDKPSSFLLASACVTQSIVLVTSETELGHVVDCVCKDLLQLDQTSHHLMLKAVVHQCCNNLSGQNMKRKQVTNSTVVAMVTNLTTAIKSCDSHMTKELMSQDGHTESTQLMLGSLLASVLQLPFSTAEDSNGHVSQLVATVTALGQLAASHLESWSPSVAHTVDEEEVIADCIDVLCLPSLLGGDEIVTMETGVESWCTLLRFMSKMAASEMGKAEGVVFESKVATTICSLVSNSQRSQLKEMFTSTFDIGAREGWSEPYSIAFLRVWSLVLGIPALPTDGRKEVRRWMSRVAITAVEMFGAVMASEMVLKAVIDVLHKLSSFPDHVGMDKPTAMLVMHGLSVVEIDGSGGLLPQDSAIWFGNQLARILLSLWRHYEKTVITNFIGFMAIVRKILLVIGSELREGPSDTRLLEECCGHFVSVSEQISNRKKLAKFAPYLIMDALNMLQQGPTPPLIDQLLYSGVYSLMDVCGEKDMVFLRASLDPSNQDLFATLLTNYSKHHKFTGQV